MNDYHVGLSIHTKGSDLKDLLYNYLQKQQTSLILNQNNIIFYALSELQEKRCFKYRTLSNT